MLFDILKSSDSSIQTIYLQYNQEFDDECMKSLGEYITSNKSIETIWLSNTSVSDTSIEIFAPYLDGNNTFKRLDLSGNKGITDKSIPLLEKMIESSYIEEIGINMAPITKKNIVYASAACNKIKDGHTSLKLYEK